MILIPNFQELAACRSESLDCSNPVTVSFTDYYPDKLLASSVALATVLILGQYIYQES